MMPRRDGHEGGYGRYPDHILKRVDRPTTLIDDAGVPRVDERDGGFTRAARGEYGPVLQRESKRFVPKHPLSGALATMTTALGGLVEPSNPDFDPARSPWAGSG